MSKKPYKFLNILIGLKTRSDIIGKEFFFYNYRNAPKSVSLMEISSRAVQNLTSVSRVNIILWIE